MKVGFSWIGIIIFALPMLINIIYVIIPPMNAPKEPAQVSRIIEFVEQATRILYMLAICFLVSERKIDYGSIWLYLGIVFLVLYYIVWIRYFLGGRDVALLSKRFFWIPIGHPLPNRKNIVVSRSKKYTGDNLVTVSSLQEAIEVAGDENIYISGGDDIKYTRTIYIRKN